MSRYEQTPKQAQKLKGDATSENFRESNKYKSLLAYRIKLDQIILVDINIYVKPVIEHGREDVHRAF